jgi:hypothetical protein
MKRSKNELALVREVLRLLDRKAKKSKNKRKENSTL